MKIVCKADPEGEEFGFKVSPWTTAGEDHRFRFGKAGLRAQFPLGRSAPQALISDPRFLDTAALVVEFFTPSDSWFGDVMSTIKASADDLARVCAGELRLPLANLLCGRTGFAADRALGGWLQLGADGPRLWMQAYVLPDHASTLPQLEAQLQKAAVAGQEPAQARAVAKLTTPDKAISAAAPAGMSNAKAWGPPQGARTANAAPVDLLELDKGPSPAEQKAVKREDEMMALVDIDLNDDGPTPQGGGGSAFAFVGQGISMGSSATATTNVPAISNNSLLGYVTSAPLQVAPPVAAPVASTPTNGLDLGALYAASAEDMKSNTGGGYTAAQTQHKFDALQPGHINWRPKEAEAGLKVESNLQGGNALAALEQSVLGNLMK
eukprot:TRINITY_DN6737_c0_g1_i1.p1 TRINITY_DN6737_c0_g1~~TRINITY_DN6737_c0_g1_i1.p1  ORF type:complete len:436 (-),score=82.11 TRINITY_DN6737_c0_g1_i1:177-1316(-)